MRTELTNRYRVTDLELGREASILARALELASETTQVSIVAEEAWRAASMHASERGDWTVIAASAARALGLHPSLCADTPMPGLRDRPAMVRVGRGQWLVVVGRRGRRLRVIRLDERGETTMTMTASQLQAVTGGQPWLHLQPLLALDPLSTRYQPRAAERPWLRLRMFLELETRDLWVVMIYAVVIGGLTLATPIAVQALVNTVAFGSVLQPLVVLTLLLLAGLSFAGVLSVLEAYVVEVLQRRVFVRVADDFGRRIPIMKFDALDQRYGPELVNRFFDVLTIQKSLSVLLLDGLAVALQTVIGMVLLGFYHPLLLAFDVVLLILLIGVLLLGRGAVSTGNRESMAKYKTAAWLEDVSRVSSLFRGAVAQSHAAQHTEMLCRNYLFARKSHFKILLRQIIGGIGLQIVAMVALLGVGGWLVINRQLTLGQLVAAELVIATISAGFIKLGKHLEKVYDLNVGVLKIANVVDVPTERQGGEAPVVTGPAAIALRHVDIARGHRTIVSAINLEIASQERLHLSGASGSGKSTVLDVLAGLRAPAEGSVQIDGLDLRRADLGLIRDQIGLVRGLDFIAGSILDNIRLAGSTNVSESSVRDLLRRVGLEDVIDGLPDGLDTVLVPSGAPLSESQARRLVLVRALIARPRVLLLDRALDGLGLPESELADVLEFVLAPSAPWTAVVVTDDPRIGERCQREVQLQERSAQVVR